MPKEKAAKERETKAKQYKRPEDTPGFAWRISLTIIVFFALIVFLVIWLFFYADAFTLYQNIAVVLASILIFIGVMGASWAFWGIKYGRQFEKCCND